MVWIIGISALALGVLIYFLVPVFKKAAKNRGEKKDRSSERELKKQQRLEKREEKKQLKKEKSVKKEDISAENPHVFELKGDEFGEDLKPLEDPDTKVNYDNLAFGGTEETPAAPKEQSAFSNNIDDMFNEYFLDEREDDKPEKPVDNVEFNSDGTVDSADGDDEEIKDFLEEFNRVSMQGKSTIKDDFENLSPEMKALMISNFLDRKDNF